MMSTPLMALTTANKLAPVVDREAAVKVIFDCINDAVLHAVCPRDHARPLAGPIVDAILSTITPRPAPKEADNA